MGAKEIRREIIDSGSPLRHHHMSQAFLKIAGEGEKRLSAVLNIPDIERVREATLLDEEALGARLPLNPDFKEGMLGKMIDIANARSGAEQDTPIPQRIANIAADVSMVYRMARTLELDTRIINQKDEGGQDTKFKLRRNNSRYPGIFPYQLFLIEFKKMPNWKFLDEEEVRFIIAWSKAYVINLTSCDFTLPAHELLGERVETLAYVLATVGALTGVSSSPRLDRRAADSVSRIFVETATRHFRKLRD